MYIIFVYVCPFWFGPLRLHLGAWRKHVRGLLSTHVSRPVVRLPLAGRACRCFLKSPASAKRPGESANAAVAASDETGQLETSKASHTYANLYVYIYIYIYMLCKYVFICNIYICITIHIYIYTHICTYNSCIYDYIHTITYICLFSLSFLQIFSGWLGKGPRVPMGTFQCVNGKPSNR